ncbi:MAG TPA: hypothetical protein VIT38_10335 [Allosphingosinicella sp.]|jgi:hypothetical protein
MVEIEVQNEADQTQKTLRFAAVPRIGEGIHLLDEQGFWASYDVVDVWYQKAPYGDIWVPYLHIRAGQTDTAAAGAAANGTESASEQRPN